MKTNAVLLAVAFVVTVTCPIARGQDPKARPPEDARKALAELDKEVKAIDEIARKAKLERLEKTLKELQDLQDGYTKASKLDEAVLVRDLIKQLKQQAVSLTLGAKVLDDPGSMTAYRGKNDEVFYFKVTGTVSGSVYGSGVYTDDSRLATAAVHSGVLKDGETGIVKVTIVEGQNSYEPSTENGVTSFMWGSWYGSYKVEAVKLEKK